MCSVLQQKRQFDHIFFLQNMQVIWRRKKRRRIQYPSLKTVLYIGKPKCEENLVKIHIQQPAYVE